MTPGPALRGLTWLDAQFNRLYGSRYNPLYQTGSIALLMFLLLLGSGLYLLLFYRIGDPWQSVARVTDQYWAGRWIRGIHCFASDALLVAVVLHAFRMFAQRRTWGPRALAWISGVGLLLFVFVCGWTGYVMVWDVQAYVIAAEGARLLDSLPIFSEPISRAFVGERPLPTAFFFLNLFAHVALPIAVGLVTWMHVSRVARPTIFPPRRLAWSLTLGLVAVSLVLPLRMSPEADLFQRPVSFVADYFFTFWIPFAHATTAGISWLAAATLTLLFLSVPILTRPQKASRPTKSFVNERLCTGCEQCTLDCPYGAIAMQTRTDGRDTLVAHVDPDVCVSCGICTGSCAPMSVGPVGLTGRDQLEEARAFAARQRLTDADIVMIGCRWSAAARQPAGILHFPVICAGNVHTSVIEFFIRSGAGGVVVCTCPERDCHGREGTIWLNERVYHDREAELQARVDRRRLRIVHAGWAETGVLERELDAFRAEVLELARAAREEHIDLVTLCREGADQAPAKELSA